MVKAELGLGQKILGTIDAIKSSASYDGSHSTYEIIYKDNGRTIGIHIRRNLFGKKVGVRMPDGTEIVEHEKSIIHEIDENGNLTKRYRLGKPPEGYSLFKPD